MVIKISRSKFNVSKNTASRTYNGIVFDSGMEMKYYRDVVLPQAGSGEILEYELQKPYTLQPKFIRDNKTVQPIIYVADFFIRCKDGSEAVIDVKGCPDNTAKLKRKLFWYNYPDIDYRWVCLSVIDGGWRDYSYVEKQRGERKKNNKKPEGNILCQNKQPH